MGIIAFFFNMLILLLYGGFIQGSGIISYIVILFFIMLILKGYFNDCFREGLFCYSFISLIGVLFVTVYYSTYNTTFSPYHDDSLYYYNSLHLSQFSLTMIPPTLFEIIMSIPLFIFKLLGIQLRHIDILPLVWGLSTVNILLAIRIAQKYFNVNKVLLMAVFSLLFNYSFLDASVHFYRDSLLILFVLLSILFLIESRYKMAIFFAFFVFLIRGANAVLLCYLIASVYMMRVYNFKLRTIILGTIIFAISFLIVGNSISSGFLRGGIASEASEALGMLDRISHRTESYATAEVGGTAALRHGGLIMTFLAPIIFTFSPFLSFPIFKEVNVIHANYNNVIGDYMGIYNMFQMESFIFWIHIFLLSFLLPRIIYSLYLGLRPNRTSEVKFICFFIILTICMITFISMQTRHRLFFFIFFPFLLYLYSQFSSSKGKNICNIAAFFSFSGLIIINLYMHL
jgi:hypothetical protein